jgi:hypothetical protein
MNINEKTTLKQQLNGLQGSLIASQAMIANARQLASMPIPTPMGPVPVPSLSMLANALDTQAHVDDMIIKFLEKMITLL